MNRKRLSQEILYDKRGWKPCIFCNKDYSQHSKKLWDMHHEVTMGKKLTRIKIGAGPETVARIHHWNAGYKIFRNEKSGKVTKIEGMKQTEFIPVYMHCGECGEVLGNAEEMLADVLGRTCLQCFCEMTEQEYIWHQGPKQCSVKGGVGQ